MKFWGMPESPRPHRTAPVYATPSARGASRRLGGCSSARSTRQNPSCRGGWAALTVAVEKLLDAGLFLDDLVGRPCTLYELFLGRDLVEHVLRRRAFNVR